VRLRTVASPSGTISSTAGTSHRSCPPLCLMACKMLMAVLPTPNSVGSMVALNGPFRGRFAIHNSLPLSVGEIFSYQTVSLCVIQQQAWRAVMKGFQWMSVAVSSSDATWFELEPTLDDRVGRGRTANAPWSSPLVSTTNSWSSVCFCNMELRADQHWL
jgi:hypothetical protein